MASLYTVVTNQTAQAQDLNQVVNVLQQPNGVGSTEQGKYWLAGWGSANGDGLSVYISTRSRGSTPFQVTIDTVDQAPTSHMSSPVAAHLSASGFQINATTTAASTNEFCGGGWTTYY